MSNRPAGGGNFLRKFDPRSGFFTRPNFLLFASSPVAKRKVPSRTQTLVQREYIMANIWSLDDQKRIAMDLYNLTAIDDRFHTCLDLTLTNGVQKKLVVFKGRADDVFDWDCIWSELVWMYWAKQQEDGVTINPDKLDLHMLCEQDALYDAYIGMRKAREIQK